MVVEPSMSRHAPQNAKLGAQKQFPGKSTPMLPNHHPVRKSLTFESQMHGSDSVRRAATYTIESRGYKIREHRIRSRLHAQVNNDGSSDDEPVHTNITHQRYVVYELLITSPTGAKQTIHRRYHDFEELNEMLPTSIASMARLPGRRFWARITGSRFAHSAIESRQGEVVAYLRRLFSMVPEYQAVQMFICDDWLSRDTSVRRRQFHQILAHQKRLEILIAHRLAEGRDPSSKAPLAGSLESSAKKPYVPSRLGPHAHHQHRQRNNELAVPSSPAMPPSPRANSSAPEPAIVFSPVHLRVSILRESVDFAAPVFSPADPCCPKPLSGTPGFRKRFRFPRGPLPADRG